MDIFNESLTSVRNIYLNNNSSPSLQRDSRRQLDLMLVLLFDSWDLFQCMYRRT
jgi:hypothetical protein